VAGGVLGAGLGLGEVPIVPPVPGEVGGEADGVRSRLGFSPTRSESLHAAVSPVSSRSAQNPVRTLFMMFGPLYEKKFYPLMSTELAIFRPAFS